MPVDEIAAAAGVGPGTVHRHFPTKELLFEAVVTARLSRLVETAHNLTKTGEAGAAFFSLLPEMVESAAHNRAIVEALAATGTDLSARTRKAKRDLDLAIAVLLKRAQQEGAVRPDINAADVSSLVIGCIHGGASTSPSVRRRLLSVVVDGLRLRPAR